MNEMKGVNANGRRCRHNVDEEARTPLHSSSPAFLFCLSFSRLSIAHTQNEKHIVS